MEAPEPPTLLDELPVALTEHVGYLGIVLGQRSQRLFEHTIASLELRPIHYDYLECLSDRRVLTQRDLARILEVDAARIVTITDDLEARGLVVREVDPRDRRRNLIRLTGPGGRLLTRARALATQVENQLLTPLTAGEGDDLRRLLRKVNGLDSPRV